MYKSILKAEIMGKINLILNQHNTSSYCIWRINFLFRSMKAFTVEPQPFPVWGSTTLPEWTNFALRRLSTASHRKNWSWFLKLPWFTVSVFLCYSWHTCKKQQAYVFWGSNSPKSIDEKASYFPAIVEQANSKEAWRRDEGRCLQQSWATQEFCSVAWQQVIICQCAASTCQQPKPTQAASTGKYMCQPTLQVSSTVP